MVELKDKQEKFWKGFVGYMNSPEICKHEVIGRSSYTLPLAARSGLRIALKISNNDIWVRIYFNKKKEGLFKFLNKQSGTLKEELGPDTLFRLVSKNGDGSEIIKETNLQGIYDGRNHMESYKWFKVQALLMMKVLPKYVDIYKEQNN